MEGINELKNIIKTIILEIFPELEGYHYPIKAKVVKVYENAGKADDYNSIYSCDVQPLTKDGSVDEDSPVIPDVEIPVIWAGPDRGIYSLPVKGATVRVGFYYNDPSYPFVDAVLPYGYNVPEHPLGSLIIQHSSGVKIEIQKDKKMLIKTPEKITIDSEDLLQILSPEMKVMVEEGNEVHPIAFADIVQQIYDGHTHPGDSGGVTGPPNQKMTGHDSNVSYTE